VALSDLNVAQFYTMQDEFRNALANATNVPNGSVHIMSVRLYNRPVNPSMMDSRRQYRLDANYSFPTNETNTGMRRLRSIGNSSNQTAENVTGVDVETYIVVSSYNSSDIIDTIYSGTYVTDLSISISGALLALSGVVVLATVSAVSVVVSNQPLGHLYGSSSSSSSAYTVKRNGMCHPSQHSYLNPHIF
jgi:hypothetical protein